jgi:hypothetical protein
MAGGEVHADGGAERNARDVGRLDTDDAEEGGDLIGITLGRVRTGRLVALAGPRKVDCDAAKVPDIGWKLECIARVVGGR